MRFTQPDTSFIIFLGFFVLMLVHLLFTFSGFYGNDDVNYARYAAQLVHQKSMRVEDTSHYALRWTCIYITALCYQLFGINEISSSLFSFFCFIGSALVISRLIVRQTAALHIFVYSLFFLSFMTLFYMHRLLPDAGICFFVVLAYYCYHQKRFSNYSDGLMAAGFSLSLFVAMLTKESVIITLPLWLCFIVRDVVYRQRTRFWLYIFSFSSLLIAGYLLYWYLATGDWLFRYHALVANHEGGGGESYQALGIAALVGRLLFELWNAFLLSGDFQYLIFALAAFVYRKTVFETERHRHICISFLILLLSANFMTYSLDGYNPLLPDPRHYMFLLPFAAVSGGFMIKAYLSTPEKYAGLIGMFCVADIFLLLSDIGFTKYVYFFITFLLIAYWAAKKYKVAFFARRLFAGAFVLILGLNYINDFVRPRYPYYFDQKKLLKVFLKQNENQAVVIGGDAMTAELASFMLGFRHEKIGFVAPTAQAEIHPETEVRYFLLVNNDYDKQFKNQSSEWMSRFNVGESDIELKENNVILYRIDPQKK